MAPEHWRAYVEQAIDLLNASVSPRREREPIASDHPLSQKSLHCDVEVIKMRAERQTELGNQAWKDMQRELYAEALGTKGGISIEQVGKGIELCFESVTFRFRSHLLRAMRGVRTDGYRKHCENLDTFLYKAYEMIFSVFLSLLFPHILHPHWTLPHLEFETDIVRDLDGLFNCCLIYSETQEWGQSGRKSTTMEELTQTISGKAHRLHSLLWQLLSWFMKSKNFKLCHFQEPGHDKLWHFQERGHDTTTYFRLQAFKQALHRPCDAIAYDLIGLHMLGNPAPSIIAPLMIKHEDRMGFKDNWISSCLIRLCSPRLTTEDIEWVEKEWKDGLKRRSEDFRGYWRSQGVMIGVIFRRFFSQLKGVSETVALLREFCFFELLTYVLDELKHGKHDMSLSFLASVCRYIELDESRGVDKFAFMSRIRESTGFKWTDIEYECGTLLYGQQVIIPASPSTWEGRMITCQFIHFKGDVETAYHTPEARDDPMYRASMLLDMKLFLKDYYETTKARRSKARRREARRKL